MDGKGRNIRQGVTKQETTERVAEQGNRRWIQGPATEARGESPADAVVGLSEGGVTKELRGVPGAPERVVQYGETGGRSAEAVDEKNPHQGTMPSKSKSLSGRCGPDRLAAALTSRVR